MWGFYFHQRVFDALQGATDQERADVKASLDLLLFDPYDPPGLFVFRFRGRYGEDLYVAELPYGWHATYRPCPNGIPPVGGRLVWIKSIDTLPPLT